MRPTIPLPLLLLLHLHNLITPTTSTSHSLSLFLSPPTTHQPASPPHKRTIPAPTTYTKQTTCPSPNWTFQESFCQRQRGPRAYQIHCTFYMGSDSRIQYCPFGYLCVDVVLEDMRESMPVLEMGTAYCVKTEYSFRLGGSTGSDSDDSEEEVNGGWEEEEEEEGRGGNGGGGMEQQSEFTALVQSSGSSGGAGRGAVAAVLTDLRGMEGAVVNASVFSIDAQVRHVLAGVETWRSVLPPGTTERCEHCASVGIGSVPPVAGRIDVKVVLGAGVEGALLWLVSLAV